MTKEEFTEKWGAIFSEPNDFKSDLDALLKEEAEKAWDICEEDAAKHYLSGNDCLYRSFEDYWKQLTKE